MKRLRADADKMKPTNIKSVMSTTITPTTVIHSTASMSVPKKTENVVASTVSTVSTVSTNASSKQERAEKKDENQSQELILPSKLDTVPAPKVK